RPGEGRIACLYSVGPAKVARRRFPPLEAGFGLVLPAGSDEKMGAQRGVKLVALGGAVAAGGTDAELAVGHRQHLRGGQHQRPSGSMSGAAAPAPDMAASSGRAMRCG